MKIKALILGLALACAPALHAQNLSTTIQKSLITDAAGAAITPSVDVTQDAAQTIATASGPLVMCRASAAAPTNVSADDDAVIMWCLRSGAQVIQPTFAGVLATTGNGASGTGVQRVTIANDSTGIVALTTGSAQIGHLEANQSVNVAQINGVTTTMGNGASGTGVQRVTIASDSTGTIVATSATAANLLARMDTSGATGAAPPARADFAGGIGSGATGGFITGVPVCDTFKAVSMTSATTTLMVTGVSGRHVRICSIHLVTAIANNVALIGGTGATCGTGTSGLAGGTTAANGWNFAANGGLALGSGLGTVIQTAVTGDSVCIITSAAGPLAGTIAYAIY